MNENDRALLNDMLEFAQRVQRRVVGKQRIDLEMDDEALGGTIIRDISVIAEAANHLTESFLNQNPQLEIPQIISMRNRVIHGYRDVNWDVVWNACLNDIPILITNIEKILSQSED